MSELLASPSTLSVTCTASGASGDGCGTSIAASPLMSSQKYSVVARYVDVPEFCDRLRSVVFFWSST